MKMRPENRVQNGTLAGAVVILLTAGFRQLGWEPTIEQAQAMVLVIGALGAWASKGEPKP